MNTLTVKDPGSGESRHVAMKFSAEELTQLRDFRAAAQDLNKAKYFKESKQASLEIKGGPDQGLKIVAYVPPAELCESLFHRMRPFVLQREDSYFPGICTLIGRRVDDPIIHTFLRSRRDLWEGKYFRGMMTVGDSFGVLNDDQALMDYLNAFQYHRDKRKQRQLSGPREWMGNDGMQAFYLMLLVEKVKAVLAVADLVDVLLGTSRALNVTFEPPLRTLS